MERVKEYLKNYYPSSIDHPERMDGETFVGNGTKEDEQNLIENGIIVRLGDTAYDIHGNKITDRADVKPMFIAEFMMDKYERLMKRTGSVYTG